MLSHAISAAGLEWGQTDKPLIFNSTEAGAWRHGHPWLETHRPPGTSSLTRQARISEPPQQLWTRGTGPCTQREEGSGYLSRIHAVKPMHNCTHTARSPPSTDQGLTRPYHENTTAASRRTKEGDCRLRWGDDRVPCAAHGHDDESKDGHPSVDGNPG
jgi:hypothetical protein